MLMLFSGTKVSFEVVLLPATHISPKDDSSYSRPCQGWIEVVKVVMCDLR